MDKPQFWQLIEEARQASGGTCEGQAGILTERLTLLSEAEIIAFDRIFMEYHSLLYQKDLWAAAYIMNGGCSDDGFFYFRAWLIGQGQVVLERALENPDTLAEVCLDRSEDAECEDLLYVARSAYEAKTGVHMTTEPYEHPDLTGADWEEDALEALYPALAARFWEPLAD